MVTPAERKPIAECLIQSYQFSQRKACDLAGISRTGFRYQPKASGDESLRQRLKALASQYPRYGYLLLHNLLKQEGLVADKKRTYRLYTNEGLQVRTKKHKKKRKKLTRPRLVMDTPQSVNQRWSMDFVADQLSNGRRFRVLNIVDDYSRELLGQLTAFSITGHQVARFLSQIIEQRGKSDSITCDNGLPVKVKKFM